VVLHVPIKPYDLVINHKHTHIYHQSYHDQHSSYCKRFILTIPSYSKLSISTQNIYLKGLSKVIGIKSSHVLKKVISHQVYATQHLKVNLVIMQVVWDKIEYAGGEVHLPSLLKHGGSSSSNTCS
jgi:hypothetical protein